MRPPSSLSIFLLSLILLAVAVSGVHVNHLDKRQVTAGPLPTGGSGGRSAVDDTDSPTPTPRPSNTPSSSKSEQPSSTPRSSSDSPSQSPSRPPPASSSQQQPSSTPPSPSQSPSTPQQSSPPSASSPNNPSPNPPATTNPPTAPSQSPSRTVVIVTFTRTTDGGSTVVETSQSSVPVTEQTNAPGLGKDKDEPHNSSGLSATNRNIIIGVVVGVGGAVILGGLAVVFFRLRRKRSRNEPDEDDLTGTAVGSHSHEPSMTNSPFKTTLDQYHNPGPVNPASNF